MNTDAILAILRKQEHYYTGDGFPAEWSNNSNIVLELDHDQDKLYTAILKTVPKTTLAEIANELRYDRNVAVSLIHKIEWLSEEHPKIGKPKNEPILTLLDLYLNKKSKQVRYARKCLRERFDKQSYRDQNRILRAFLEGPAIDCDWAGRVLRDNWRKELSGKIKEAWARSKRQMLAYVILRYFPNRYILQEQLSLTQTAGYQYVCARIGNEPEFEMDESRLSTPELLYVMAKLGRTVEDEVMEKRIYDFLLHYEGYYDLLSVTPSFSCIPGWDKMIWAMGVLGMQDALIRLLGFENRIKENQSTEELDMEDKWSHFVTAIKNEIDPEGVSGRLEREISAMRAKCGIYNFGKPSQLMDEDEKSEDTDTWIDDNYEQKVWYYNDERSKNPFMTLKEEWMLFVEVFYYDRPRLQALMMNARLSEEWGFLNIQLVVHNNAQEDWLKQNGILKEIKDSFQDICSYPISEYDISIIRSENFEYITYQ